jgi:large subunit ribosomal protein L10
MNTIQKGANKLNKIKVAMGQEYALRLSNSPFFLLIDYKGVTVAQFTDLRKRLMDVGAEAHVVNTSVFRTVADVAGLKDVGVGLTGQMAVVTGQKDVAAAAKVVKTFNKETQKGVLCYGYIDGERTESATLNLLADLPPLNELRAKLLGTIMAPATKLVGTLAAPMQQLARVIQARADKESN